MNSIIAFIKKEAVLSAALFLAVLSSFLVPPSAAYFSYIDWKTLCLLFALMAIMAGYQDIGLFRRIGQALLGTAKSTLGLICVLVFLPFFLSMIITNDVALITFVPFALTVLVMGKQQELIIPVVGLQTIAANLGSMLLPMGNPQNLYLYGKSGISLPVFVGIMLPYTIISGVLLLVCCVVVGSKRKSAGQLLSGAAESASPEKLDVRSLVLYSLLFVLAFCSIAKILSPYILAAVVLVFFIFYNRSILKRVDYSLLLTFIGFFVFIGNMKQLPAFNSFFARIITGNETPVAVAVSQIISNVPAALLLSGFTDDCRALIIGTNLGGLGTLIASMASLISFKQISRETPELKGRYFVWFTVSNILFLIILMAAWFLIR